MTKFVLNSGDPDLPIHAMEEGRYVVMNNILPKV